MPRTTTLESAGCPPIRALTFDSLGLIKVIEARDKVAGIPKVVERWGVPDALRGVVAASMDDCKAYPLLAVARKNGTIEVISPMTGQQSFSIPHETEAGTSPDYDLIVGLHLFKRNKMQQSSRCYTSACIVGLTIQLQFCSNVWGNACLRSVKIPKPAESVVLDTPKTWKFSGSGNIHCFKVDAAEKYSIVGGKGVEVNMWDLESTSRIWSAKPPPKNNLGIFTPTWFTSLTFLSNDDHRKFVAGTNSHQVRLYDISAQRRPVLSVDFRESPIKALAEDIDGHTIYLGTGSGDLASIDMRTGKLLGCFLGKCSGSIRSIVRHPELPVLASCGLDCYLRLWDSSTRQLLSAVFLKQHLTNVILDPYYTIEVSTETTTTTKAHLLGDREDVDEGHNETEEEPKPVKRKKAHKKIRNHKNNESSKKAKKLE
ncbi:WD repeat-containing protein [Drosera capensis]